MVDQIKNNIASSTKSVSQTNSSGESKKTLTSSAKIIQKNDQSSQNSTNITKFISKEAIKDMAVQPPIDKEKVSRIKRYHRIERCNQIKRCNRIKPGIIKLKGII